MDAKIFVQILEIAFSKKVSDVHFETGNPPFFRGKEQIIRSKLPDLTAEDTEFIAQQILEHNNRRWEADQKEFDTSFSLPSGARFRVSIFIQREVGIDTLSFHSALRASLRMDPDLIMVGEMRDTETIDACLMAAETGH